MPHFSLMIINDPKTTIYYHLFINCSFSLNKQQSPPLGPPRGHKAQNTIFEIFGLLRAQFWEPFREKNGQIAKSTRMPPQNRFMPKNKYKKLFRGWKAGAQPPLAPTSAALRIAWIGSIKNPPNFLVTPSLLNGCTSLSLRLYRGYPDF